jgi:SAM-dependent methyltransferase
MKESLVGGSMVYRLVCAVLFSLVYASSTPLVAAQSLAELCKTHKTDKCASDHNYVELYEKFFSPVRNQAKRVLEIGVWRGDSLRLWEEYFPSARIFGIDINDSSRYNTERIITAIADQANREQLGQFIEAHGSDFDIVIDDGGHTMEQQQTSFGFLFPHVRPGGIYIIEDVHTSFPNLYPDYGVEVDERNSTFSMINNFVRSGKFQSKYLTEQELQYLTTHVEHCLSSYRATTHHSVFFFCEKK